MPDDPIEFLRTLANAKTTNSKRWVGLVWWYSAHQRSLEATSRRICQDMEAAGYGSKERPASQRRFAATDVSREAKAAHSAFESRLKRVLTRNSRNMR